LATKINPPKALFGAVIAQSSATFARFNAILDRKKGYFRPKTAFSALAH
jgi:hypothetical protein